MVYGNLNKDSGSGVAFSRRPGGNDSVPVGEFLSNAEGKEVLDGKRKPTPFEVSFILNSLFYLFYYFEIV